MDTSHLPQDRNRPAVFDPHPTQAWTARQAATDLTQLVTGQLQAIRELVGHIEQHRHRRGVVILKARDIHTRVAALVAGGKISVNDIDHLELARSDLRDLLAGLDETAVLASTAVETRPPAECVPASVDAAAAVVRQVHAERDRLPDPATLSRWPWRDRAQRRQVRAWHRAWCLTLADPVDTAKVEQAWDRYLATREAQAPTAQLPRKGPDHE